MTGFYVYIHKKPDGTPFYIGKGRNRRAWRKDNRNPHWHHIVAKHGFEVEILISELSEEDAFAEEIRLIAEYRKLHKLVNATDGGEGSSGHVHTLETREKLSQIHKVSERAQEHRIKLGLSRRGTTLPEETIVKMREASRKKALDPEFRAKVSAGVRRALDNPDYRQSISDGVRRAQTPSYREKLSEASKRRWKDPVYRAYMSALSKGRKHPPRSEETRQKISKAQKGKKRAPFSEEHRRNMSETNHWRKPITVCGQNFRSVGDFAKFVGRHYQTVIAWVNRGDNGKMEMAYEKTKAK